MNWDYIAGFFDGEGNIHVNKPKGNQYQLIIRIYNSNLKVLESIGEFIDMGYIYKKKKTGMFELVIIPKSDVKKFLEEIKNRTIIKKGAIEFILNNYNFKKGESNIYFDIETLRNFITRKGCKRKYFSIKKPISFVDSLSEEVKRITINENA